MYNQCDRNFGCCGKLKERMENIYTFDTYVDMLKSCRNIPIPFKVVNGSKLVKNCKSTIDLHTHRLPFMLRK